jgi:hypothetical protein
LHLTFSCCINEVFSSEIKQKFIFVQYDEKVCATFTKSRAAAAKSAKIGKNLDFYQLTTTCTQIDVYELLRKGMQLEHGWIRPARHFESAMMLSAVIIQGNQNEQHGGQSIPDVDYFFISVTFTKSAKNFFDTSNYNKNRRNNGGDFTL